MRPQIIISIILVMVSSACSTIKKTEGELTQVVFSMRKTGCKGTCPEYFMTISNHGEVILDGKRNFRWIGRHRKHLSRKELNRLIGEFRKAHFFSYEDEYTAFITDLPTTYIQYCEKGQSKTIRDYYGAPDTLKKLEQQLEAIVAQEGWEKVE